MTQHCSRAYSNTYTHTQYTHIRVNKQTHPSTKKTTYFDPIKLIFQEIFNNDRIKTIIGDHTENNRTNYRQTIKVNENVTVSGNSVKHVNGTTKQTSLLDLSMGSKNNFSIQAVSNVNISTESHFRANTAATFDVQAVGNIELDTPAEIKIGKDTVTVGINGVETPSQPTLVDIDGGTIDVDGSSEVDIDGGIINLN